MEDFKHGIYILSIVAIVAVFGLLYLSLGQKTQYTVQDNSQLAGNIGGEAKYIPPVDYALGYNKASWFCNDPLDGLNYFREQSSDICQTKEYWDLTSKEDCVKHDATLANINYIDSCKILDASNQ